MTTIMQIFELPLRAHFEMQEMLAPDGRAWNGQKALTADRIRVVTGFVSCQFGHKQALLRCIQFILPSPAGLPWC